MKRIKHNRRSPAKRDEGGQALVEYILLVCIIAIGLYGMTKLFSKWTQLIFQQHVISLGYEIPHEDKLIPIKKEIIKMKMKSYELQSKIRKHYEK
jgi:Flp pilus assembly pilin Flp